MTDDIREIRKELALRVIDRNFEYSESILKLCITTLAALNGGALVTLIGIDALRSTVLKEVGWYFGGGVIASIVASFLFAMAYANWAQQMAERLWQNSLLDRDSFKSVLLLIAGGSGAWPAGIGFLSAIASGIFLVVGGLEVAHVTSGVDQ